MDIPIKQTDSLDSDVKFNKRRKKTSMVWDHFTIFTVNADCVRAFCNQCKKSFAYISGSKQAGTSHLKRHIALGICPVSRNNQDNDQLGPSTPSPRSIISVNGTNRPRKRYQAGSKVANIYLNEDFCSREFVKMIIRHDYPLHMCQHSGFVDFVRALHPELNMTSVSDVEEQILRTYLREKQQILDLLNGISGHISLAIDFWTSNQSLVYVLLSGHFIDKDWKLQRRILNFVRIPFPDSDTVFNNVVASCMADWNSEGKLLTITVDHSNANKNARGNLRRLISIKNSLILNGQLIINSCYTRTLSSLAKDAIGCIKETINMVRDCVKFVKTSEAHEERFNKLRLLLQVSSNKTLATDDLTKWNTTYDMLMAASELEQVFSCLDTIDPDYKLTPSTEEWLQVKALCKYLEVLYEAASILTSPVYPTSNIFFHKVCGIQLKLMEDYASPDFFLCHLSKRLLENFSRYWEDCYLVLAIAVVMDPRFKMQLVKFNFSRIYGVDAESWIKIVDEGLHELYLEYVVQCLPAPTFLEEGNDTLLKIEAPQEDNLVSNGDDFPDFDIYISDIMGGQQHLKSELDQYLEESVLPRVQGFDVLGWWKVNRTKYPTLAKMASDVLSIPFSTVPPDSVFDTGDRKIGGHQSSLQPTTLQALVCAKDWLQYECSDSPYRISGKDIPTEIVKPEF
ncbi:zinc finger BED domain-containing protein DAYSLEEPER-like [Primulina huaijiensis]|uniref:zinc finger BED domain-containing protein DAYSLEEPER-like n=1 Tax=Primulina huaijiensis TaxID=1492673 RepID=UPI003CC7096A